MPLARFALLLPLILLSVAIPGAGQGQLTKDPMAVTVLAQMAAATDWNALNVPRDAVAGGSITRYQGSTTAPVGFTLKVKACREYRSDVQEITGTRSTIVNGDSAAVLFSNDTRFVPPHSAISMKPVALPFFCDLATFSDANVSLHYVGTETVAGQLGHRVDMSREPSRSDPLAAPRRRASRMTVWISTTTALPVQIASIRVANDSPTATATTIRVFSDYRLVNGIAVPFHQEEYSGGQLLYTLQLNSLSFNVG